MAFKFIECSNCGAKYHIRVIKRKISGIFKGDIVYIDQFDCHCGHKTIFRIHTPTIDSLYLKVLMLECDLHKFSKEPAEYEKTLAELNKAKNELNMITDEVEQCLHLKILS